MNANLYHFESTKELAQFYRNKANECQKVLDSRLGDNYAQKQVLRREMNTWNTAAQVLEDSNLWKPKEG